MLEVDPGREVINNETFQATLMGSSKITIHLMPNDGEAIVKVNGFDFYSFKLVTEDNEFFILAQGPSLEGVLSVYRNLRENYEYRLRYNESGQFFIKEMELQRTFENSNAGETIRKNWFKRNLSPIGMYHFFLFMAKVFEDLQL